MGSLCSRSNGWDTTTPTYATVIPPNFVGSLWTLACIGISILRIRGKKSPLWVTWLCGGSTSGITYQRPNGVRFMHLHIHYSTSFDLRSGTDCGIAVNVHLHCSSCQFVNRENDPGRIRKQEYYQPRPMMRSLQWAEWGQTSYRWDSIWWNEYRRLSIKPIGQSWFHLMCSVQ